MILTTAELREYLTTDETDNALKAKLEAIEMMIRAHTNNNFQMRGIRCAGDVVGGEFFCAGGAPFKVGDTVQITESETNPDLLVTVTAVVDHTFTVAEYVEDDCFILLTKVVYPTDVKMGVVNLLKWDIERRDKVGIQSESISRHTVNYTDMTSANAVAGYPTMLMGFLKPYMKARFGRGVTL